jgi:hypothetical protein
MQRWCTEFSYHDMEILVNLRRGRGGRIHSYRKRSMHIPKR